MENSFYAYLTTCLVVGMSSMKRGRLLELLSLMSKGKYFHQRHITNLPIQNISKIDLYILLEVY
jgi:hypothetical protein